MTIKPHTIRFPTELHSEIKKIANMTRRSFNSEVVKLIEEGIHGRSAIAFAGEYDREEYDRKILALTEIERQRLIEGEWGQVNSEPKEISIADEVRRRLGT